MALQSAALLCSLLLNGKNPARVPDADAQAGLQRRYVAAWRKAFVPRLRLAAAFAHLAMRPVGAAALMTIVRAWPRLLTRGARWGGKVRFAESTSAPDPRAALGSRPAESSAVPES